MKKSGVIFVGLALLVGTSWFSYRLGYADAGTLNASFSAFDKYTSLTHLEEGDVEPVIEALRTEVYVNTALALEPVHVPGIARSLGGLNVLDLDGFVCVVMDDMKHNLPGSNEFRIELENRLASSGRECVGNTAVSG